MSPLWSMLTQNVHLAALAAFGVAATLNPRDGSASVAITVIDMEPALQESGRRSVVKLFVNLASVQPCPHIGDTVTFSGLVYSVMEEPVDVDGGATLKLRVN